MNFTIACGDLKRLKRLKRARLAEILDRLGHLLQTLLVLLPVLGIAAYAECLCEACSIRSSRYADRDHACASIPGLRPA